MGVLARALKNISRRKVRTLLVVLALGFSMSIMVSIPAGLTANQEFVRRITESFTNAITRTQEEINKTATLIECSTSPPARGIHMLRPSGFWSVFNQTFLNETIVDKLYSIDGVKYVIPFLETSSSETVQETISTPFGNRTFYRPAYTIIGIYLNASVLAEYTVLPTNITAGESLYEGDNGYILISLDLNSYFGVGVGGTVEINGESFVVKGIFASAGQARTVYMELSDAQKVTGLNGKINRLYVYVRNASVVTQVADAIKAMYPELYVTTYRDRLENLQRMQEMYTQTLSNAESSLAQAQATATQLIIIAIAATSLIVFFVMLYSARERTREIGILKAIGFSNWNVMSQFMLEGMLIGVIGGVAGVIIGSIAAPFLSSILLPKLNLFGGAQQQPTIRPFQTRYPSVIGTQGYSSAAVLSPQLILLTIGIAAVLGALGSLYPAWRASRISPMEALRYE